MPTWRKLHDDINIYGYRIQPRKADLNTLFPIFYKEDLIRLAGITSLRPQIVESYSLILKPNSIQGPYSFNALTILYLPLRHKFNVYVGENKTKIPIPASRPYSVAIGDNTTFHLESKKPESQLILYFNKRLDKNAFNIEEDNI